MSSIPDVSKVNYNGVLYNVKDAVTRGKMDEVEAARQQAIQDIQAEGQTQTGAVTAEGTAQKNAVTAEGTRVLGTIPNDYTAMAGDVGNLKSQTNDSQKILTGLGYISFISNTVIIASTGQAVTGSDNTVQSSDYVEIESGVTEITCPMRIAYPTTNSGLAFYDSEQDYISGVREDYSSSAWGYNIKKVSVPPAAKYVRFTYYSNESQVTHPEFYAETNKNIREQVDSLSENESTVKSLIYKNYPSYVIDGTGSNSDGNNIYANEGLVPGTYIGLIVYTNSGNQTISVYKYNKSTYATELIESFQSNVSGMNNLTFTNPVILADGYGLGVKAVQKYISNYSGAVAYNVTSKDSFNAFICHEFIRLVENLVALEDKVNQVAISQTTINNFSVIGDSISTFAGYLPTGYSTFYPGSTDVAVVDDMWWKIVEKETGLTPLKIAAWSGSGITGSRTGTAVIGCSQARCNDLAIRDGQGNITTAPDVVIVYIGINNFTTAMGDYTAKTAMPTADTLSTFSEAYAVMLNNIKTTYPDAVVFCCTLLPNYKNDSDANSPYDFPRINGNGVTIEDFNNTIVTLARAFSCNVIYLSDANINRNNATTYLYDYLHPNKAGQKRLGEVISKYVWAYLRSIR